jgi:hypothetical protein
MSHPLGDLLDSARERAGLTPAEVWRRLAERGIDVDRSLVYRWFKSDHTHRAVVLGLLEPLGLVLALTDEERLDAIRLASLEMRAQDEAAA